MKIINEIYYERQYMAENQPIKELCKYKVGETFYDEQGEGRECKSIEKRGTSYTVTFSDGSEHEIMSIKEIKRVVI